MTSYIESKLNKTMSNMIKKVKASLPCDLMVWTLEDDFKPSGPGIEN